VQSFLEAYVRGKYFSKYNKYIKKEHLPSKIIGVVKGGDRFLE
jgi:hypothetical protein